MTTIVLDAYKGWPVAKLKERCRQLCRISMHKDDIITEMAGRLMGGIDALPESYREEVRRISTALDD